MAVNATVIRALAAVYSVEALEAMRVTAAGEVIAGVQVTQVSFEGGAASGRGTMTPAEVLELIQAVLEYKAAEEVSAGSGGGANSAFVDLSQRQWGT